MGHHVADFAPLDQRDARRSEYTLAFELGGGSVVATTLMRPDGKLVEVELSRTIVEVGRERHLLTVGRDVTEQWRLEKQLRQAQKIEAVGRLAGGVSHDFNNTLSVVIGYADLLVAELRPGDPMRNDIEEISRAGQRGSQLTRQLLMFSRQQPLEPSVFSLNELLAGVDGMLRRLIGEDIELRVRLAPTTGFIRADSGSIEQVIMNLVVNARDAMPTGGTLTIETCDMLLDERLSRELGGIKPGPCVKMSTTDTGVGMNEATRLRVFEPFFTTKDKTKGTGLGLSTVFGIVQQSGGGIAVESELERGTTFVVYFPRLEEAAVGPRVTQPPTSACGTETILVVEDDAQVRIVTCGILRRYGYRVLEARNANEALMLCGYSETIHLLLTDVVMPQMSGPTLVKRLAGHQPEMKVLFMSGYTDDHFTQHEVLIGEFPFLQKPITPASLARRVREVLGQSRTPV